MGFSGTSATPAVQIFDASGYPWVIMGTLISIPAAGFAPALFVANANGIVVGGPGANARIVAPSGLGLIGANLDTAVSRNEFVGNNGWVVPAAPSYGVSYITFPTVPTTGNITVAGAVNGDFTLNIPASYILVAGNNIDVTQTGNLFGSRTFLQAGIVGTAESMPVGGVAGVTVNRLWVVDGGGSQRACCFVGTATGGVNNINVDPTATGDITNVGSISSVSTYLVVEGKGNVRNGTLGNTDPTIGMFSDVGIYIDSYSDASTVSLFGILSGYTTNKTLPLLQVNGYSANSVPVSYHPDVVINTIKPGGQPSNITTTGPVTIYGGNIAINSKINDKANSAGGVQGDFDLYVNASKTLSVTADVGAGADVHLISHGTMTISGNVLSDEDAGGNGGIYVSNFTNGAATTISGNLTVPLSSFDDLRVESNGPLTVSGAMTTSNTSSDIYLHNHGTGPGNFTTISGNVTAGGYVYIDNFVSPTNNPLTVSGNVSAGGNAIIYNGGSSLGNTTTVSGNVTTTGLGGTGDIYISNFGGLVGNLTVTGTLSAFRDANIFSDGNGQVRVVGAGRNINTTVLGTALLVDGAWTAGNTATINSTLATTSLKPAALITAPNVTFNGLNFFSVNGAGTAFTGLGQKPTSQLMTNNFTLFVRGTINGRVAGTTIWTSNSFDIAPLFTLSPVFVHASAIGGGFQSVNLKVLGDEVFDTGITTTPFIGVPTTTGGFPAGGLQGNLGSQLINQATGYIKIMGTPTFTLFGPPLAAQWPGGAAFMAGTTLELLAPFYNAWSVDSPPYGGSFFTAPYIALSSYIATSGTAWANFSTMPVTGNPVVYQIRQLTPTSFGFEATTNFVHNDYRNSIAGGVVCLVTGPTTWTACP
jgi:hypothetical protein